MKKIAFSVSLLAGIFAFAQETKEAKEAKVKDIEGVVITKTKKAIEQKADRTIFDFSEQPHLNNGNVLEGIKKLPGLVSTDIAGMIYQGKVLEVYLNGRPLNITSTELNSFLEGMPANAIERIEVITQPGAEFPATAGGAIMNIITNKNANKYLTATYSGNYNFTNEDQFRSRFSNSINLNARNKYFGWQLTAGQNYRESMLKGNQDDLSFTDTDRIGRGYFAKAGITVDFVLDRFLLNYDLYNNLNDSYTQSRGEADIFTAPNVPFRPIRFSAFDAANSFSLRHDAVATYQKRFSDKQKKLDFQLGFTRADNEFSQNNIFRDGFFTDTAIPQPYALGSGTVLDNSSELTIGNFKIDYSQPIKILDEGKMSIGGLFEQQNFDTESRGLTNLEYQRQTASTYLEFQAKYKNFDFIAGARGENYDISGVTRLANGSAITETPLIPFNTFKIFPNASIQYSVMKQLYAVANYNRKITLPSISALNPNNNTLQLLNAQANGNPFLQPTIFDNYELKISAFDYAFIGYNVSHAKNQVAQIVRREGKNIYNQQTNIADMKIHNFNVGLPVPFMIFNTPLSEIMKFNFNPDKINFMYVYAGYQKHDIENLQNNGFWIFNIMTQLILPKDLNLNINYSYLTKRAGYYYYIAEKPFNNSLNVTLTKKFMDNRLTVSVFGNDILNGQQMQVRTNNPDGGQNVFIRSKYDTRNFGLSINYKIPTKNKLAKEDATILNSKKEETGGIMQQGQ